jgi:cytochrome c biogenesis protein CcdA
MQEWISHYLQSPTFSLSVLPAAFLLGLVGSVTCSCCSLPVIGVVAGYSGSLSERAERRDIVYGGLFFMVGTIIALAILGAVAGFISQALETTLGSYWKLFAGLVMVVFGLITLGLFPFKLPSFGFGTKAAPRGFTKSMLFGLAVGGGATACSIGCNPMLYAVLGMATVQGQILWGAAILAVFAIGFSLPVAAAIIGLGLGFAKLTSVVEKSAPVIKIVTGVLLIGLGFYFLLFA